MKSLLCALCLATATGAAQWHDGPGEVPYVPTPTEAVEAMLKLGGAKPGDVVYDLGCGDGRIVIMAAQKFGARATGVDINPVRVKEAEKNARQAGVSGKVIFLQKNLFETDVRDATLVTLYLLPEVNLRLRPKLLHELRTGSRIVSNSFDMGDWKPDRKIDISGGTVYLWTVTESAKRQFGVLIEGAWAFRMQSPNGDVQARLILNTEGRRLTGALQLDGNRRLEIQDGTWDAELITFTLRRERPDGGFMIYHMSGSVEGGEIRGKAETESNGQVVTRDWTAKRSR